MTEQRDEKVDGGGSFVMTEMEVLRVRLATSETEIVARQIEKHQSEIKYLALRIKELNQELSKKKANEQETISSLFLSRGLGSCKIVGVKANIISYEKI